MTLRHCDEALQRNPSCVHALLDKALALRGKGDDIGAVQTWEAFVRLVPPGSGDVATVKKLVAESSARLGAQVTPAPSVKRVTLPASLFRKRLKSSITNAFRCVLDAEGNYRISARASLH